MSGHWSYITCCVRQHCRMNRLLKWFWHFHYLLFYYFKNVNKKELSVPPALSHYNVLCVPHICCGLAWLGLVHVFRAIKTKAYDRFVFNVYVHVQQYHFSMRCSEIVRHGGIECGRMLSAVCFVVLATFKHVVCIRDSRVVLIIHHLRDGCNRRIEQHSSGLSVFSLIFFVSVR